MNCVRRFRRIHILILEIKGLTKRSKPCDCEWFPHFASPVADRDLKSNSFTGFRRPFGFDFCELLFRFALDKLDNPFSLYGNFC